ncbi:MAG: lipid II flippase MurJ, partial [Planctomycetota bacterium]
MTSVNRTILRDSMIVTAVGFLGQGFGILVMMMVAGRFGVSTETDAYYMAFILPGMLMAITGGIIKMVYVPIFVEERINRPDQIPFILGSSLQFMLGLSILGMAVIAACAHLRIFSFAGNPEATALCARLLLELLPLVPLTALTAILGATYNAHQKFGLVESTQSLRYLIVLATLWFTADRWGIHSLVVGHILGQTAALLVALYTVFIRLKVPVTFRFTLHPAFRRMLSLSLFPFLGYGVAQATPFISRIISTWLPAGSVAGLSY